MTRTDGVVSVKKNFERTNICQVLSFSQVENGKYSGEFLPGRDNEKYSHDKVEEDKMCHHITKSREDPV
jgi:hypothetical protein